MKKRTTYQPFLRVFAEFRLAIAASALMITLVFVSQLVFGQTTVFHDQFNRAVLNTGGPTTYTTTLTAGDGGASIIGSAFLVLTNDATAGANANGIVYTTGLVSSYSSPYNSTLSSNTSVIEWTFNLKFNRISSTNPASPSAGSYGMAVVLAGTNASLYNTGNGYAVVYGNTLTPDPIRLVRYTGGVTGTLTNICSSGANDIANTNNYASVRVLYNPTGNSWKLFVRDDGTSAWVDPTSGVTSQKGVTTSDATYTSTALGTFGFLWSYASGANQSSQYDNFRVTTGNCFNVPPQPGAFTASSADVCQGQTGYVYTVPNDPLATYTWSYTGGTGATINGTGNSVTVDFNGSATSGTLEVIASNVCGTSIARTIGITVHPPALQPDPFIAFSPSVCPSLTGVLYAVPNDPTVTYNWNYTGTGVTINGTGNIVTLDFSGSATSGTLEVTATSINGCGSSAPRTIAITVESPATITCIGNVTQGNDSPLCNAVVTYGAPTVGGTSPTISYLFSGATSGIGTGDGSGSTFNAGITTVTVTASNTCASPSCAFDVEVTKTDPTAPTSVTSDDLDNEICDGQSITFTANGSTAGSVGGVVVWYEGGCGTGAPLGTGTTLTLDGQGGNPPVPAIGTHIYYARVQDNCSENSTCASLSITVSAGPPANTITAVNAPVNACSGVQALVTATTSGGAGVSYSWTQGSSSNTVLFSETAGGPFTAGPIVTTSPQTYVEFGTPAGWSGYYVCAQATNGCGTTTSTCQWIRGIVNGPGPITPSTQVVACPNDVKVYSCGISNGASVYIWTLNGSQAPISPNGGNNPTNVSVTFPSNFTSGQLCVTAALSCMGSSTSAPRCITINSIPSGVGTITGPATVCSGATNVSYSVPSVPGASGYNWTVPANATITSGVNTPAITVDFPTPYTGTGSVCVTATGPCGSSGTKCKSVVSGIPNMPAGITGPLTNVCNSTVQYSVVNPVASSYTWTPPAGTTITSGQGTSTIQLSVSPTFISGNLSVVANSSLCPPATSAPRLSSTFWGKPGTPGIITQSPPGPFCSGDLLNFSVVDQTPGQPPSYLWTSSNGTITAGQGANNINVTWGTNAPGTISVRASNGCGLSPAARSQVFNTNNCREEGTYTSSATAFSIYPNPAHDHLTVSIEANEHANFSLQLKDVSGRIVLAESRTGLAGLNIYELNLSNLSKGVYMLEVKSVNHNWKSKLVME